MADINHLWLRAAYILRNADWQAKLGLALLVAACLLGFELAVQHAQQKKLRSELAQAPRVQSVVQPQQAGNLAHKFYQILPPQTQVDALSASIFRAADGLGLRFDHAGFSNTTTNTGLVQCQIKLPVKGTYMQVRQFLNALLNAHPTLALDSMHMERKDAFADKVEADLVFTLYLREARQ